MNLDDIVGSWPALVARLEADGALRRWAAHEPDLVAYARITDLLAHTEQGASKETADKVLGALVRLAATDGGADTDATLLLLHLLERGMAAVAARYADLSPDINFLVVGEMAAQIRAFPWQRRHRAIAASLTLDTRRAVLRELLPRRARGIRTGEDRLIDPTDLGRLIEQPVLSSEEDIPVVEIVDRAEAAGLASRADLKLLLEMFNRPRYGGMGALAAEQGITTRTLRRRRDRALIALRQAAREYLADAA